MKIKVLREIEIEPATIRVNVTVRYQEEDIPNDFPFRKGDMWNVDIDIATGKIKDWPAGRTGEVDMKVCDEGSYYLLDKSNKILGKIEENYVPHCIPQEWGDYIRFAIGKDGNVSGWKEVCTAERIAESFFPKD